jgi:hypothetical protein
MGSEFDGWVYWHFFTIIINYNKKSKAIPVTGREVP